MVLGGMVVWEVWEGGYYKGEVGGWFWGGWGVLGGMEGGWRVLRRRGRGVGGGVGGVWSGRGRR